ncbi:MAG: OmpA family protein [Desulfobacteraceae bacterium]|nr:MAG: OmpA family protein [Desulfobacteraceae bacterium]
MRTGGEMKKRLLISTLCLLTGVSVCQAGWLDKTLEGVGKQLGNRAVKDAGNSVYDSAKEGVKDAVKGDKSDPQKEPVNTNQPMQKEGDTKGSARSESSEASPATSADNLTIEEAEKVLTKFDFIPGDKMIFFDDFSDTDVGEFPRKWTLDGPKQGRSNTVDVVEYQGKRFLRSVPGDKGQPPATQYLRLDQKGDFPEKFTIEFDAVLAPFKEGSSYHNIYRVLFVPADRKADVFNWNAPYSVNISGRESTSANTKTNVGLSDGKVHHVAISVNGTFAKAYIDNRRVINDPDGIKRPIKQVGLQMLMPNNYKSDKLLFANFRLADGGKDIKSALDTDGKIITHGILFDTGKAAIKAESLPTLKRILGLLSEDPELKFSIEGHTDNQGGKGINQPLSEKRAEAVKTWLEGKGIESNRLKTAGFGDSKPLDSNKTLEGRANNRRVEFVKF